MSDNYTAISSKSMNELNGLLEQAISLEQAVKQMEDDLGAAKAALTRLRNLSIPELMMEMGISEVSFHGWKVALVDYVSGSIPKEADKKELAMNWLTMNGADGIIKTKVNCDFTRNEHNEALALADSIRRLGYEPSVDTSVHAQTLYAFIRERLRKGEDVDLDILGCSVGTTTKLKQEKSNG